VKKQYMRNHELWHINQDDLPVYGTIASQFNDPGMNTLYKAVMDTIVNTTKAALKSTFTISNEMSEKIFIIPPARTRYLSEIAENNRAYDKNAAQQAEVAQKLYGIYKTVESILGEKPKLDKVGLDIDSKESNENKDFIKLLLGEFDRVKLNLDPYNWEIL